MVTSVLAAAVMSLQALDVTATVDRDELSLGDEIALTIIVEGRADLPVEITDPPLNGLQVVGMSDRSAVSIEGGVSGRSSTRIIRLRAIRAGRAIIGPVRVQQGDVEVTTRPINLTVTSATTDPAVVPDHVRRLVQQRAPPVLERDEVFVEVLASSGRIVLGEELDLIVLAWFPRHVRSRLRNPPQLEPPQLQGAWAYRQGAPGAIATSRSVSGVWYDVYVHSQVAFPLTPGEFAVGPATVSYNLPLTYSFLSRELRHEVQSDSVFVAVGEQPQANRPFAFDGAAGQDLVFTLSAERTALVVGEAVEVVATLSGQGNVALWPEPRFEWPTGLRVYPERVDVELDTTSPRNIGGTKNFHYLVVADSVGSHRLPPVDYPYFDVGARSYRVVAVDQLEFRTTSSGVVVAQSPEPMLPLMPNGGWVDPNRWVAGLPVWAWIVLAALPPLLALMAHFTPRFRWQRSREQTHIVSELDRLDYDFRNALSGLVAQDQVHEKDALADALRAAGVEASLAAQAARIRERLWHARYGPVGEVDVSELAAETNEVLQALLGARNAHNGVGVLGILFATSLLVGVGPLMAQSAERLYETGAFKNAADSFAVRARGEPWGASHWHNLGITLRRLGAPAESRAALVRAARLRPRDAAIRNALDRVTTPDRVSRELTWISVLAPAEAIVLGVVVWVVAWSLTAWRRRRWAIAAVVVAAMLVAYGGYVYSRYDQLVAFVIAPDTPLRVAPYGTAPGNGVLHEATAVRVSRIEGGWAFVEHGTGRGWLLMRELVTL